MIPLSDDNKLIYLLGSKDFDDTYNFHMKNNMDGCFNVSEYVFHTDYDDFNFGYLESVFSYHMHNNCPVSPFVVNDEKFVLLLTFDVKFSSASSVKHGYEVVGSDERRMFIIFDTKEEYEYQLEIIKRYLKKPFDINDAVV